jgi:hypothetical protein
MITLLLHLFRLLPILCGGHRQLALENLALRQQLAVYKRTLSRPKLGTVDRLLWVWLARCPFLNPSRCSEDRLRSFVRSSSEGHPAWTHVFRVEFQTSGEEAVEPR